jgi:hypothetical protein
MKHLDKQATNTLVGTKPTDFQPPHKHLITGQRSEQLRSNRKESCPASIPKAILNQSTRQTITMTTFSVPV